MSASLYTHVMRYCADGCGFKKVPCHGHREERTPAPPAAPVEFTMPEPRSVKPMDSLVRAGQYQAQNVLTGRPSKLTVRQERQVRRMAERAKHRATRAAS